MLTRLLMMAAICCTLFAFTAFGQEAQPQTSPQETPVAAPSPDIEPKKEGTVRIGIVPVKNQIKQDELGTDMSELVRMRWYSFLQGPAVELIPIESRSQAQVKVEASQKQCDFVLFSSVSQKAKSSLFGSFVKVAVPLVISAVPVPMPGGVDQAVSQSIRTKIQDGAKDAGKNMALQAANNVKASDQIVLEFNFVSITSSTSLAARSLKGKAKADGDDVFSRLIEEASEQVLQVALKN